MTINRRLFVGAGAAALASPALLRSAWAAIPFVVVLIGVLLVISFTPGLVMLPVAWLGP